MEAEAINISNVSYRYASVRNVLDNINFSIRQSTITAIIGKSGSGKSTLLQIINGIIKPSEGQVRLQGNAIDYNNTHALRLHIGYVIQHIGLFPHMTIGENISILGKIIKKPKEEIKTRVKELIDMVRLPATYLNKFPHELSGGEQQRAGLCRALLLKPPILLMDEPFASLDSETKQGIYYHLLEIQKRECRTIVIVTHDLEEAIVLADHFIWIEGGKIKANDKKSALIKLKDTYFT